MQHIILYQISLILIALCVMGGFANDNDLKPLFLGLIDAIIVMVSMIFILS